MYPATSYELARAGTADRRHQARREARARAESSATIRKRPPRACAGSDQYSADLGRSPRSHGRRP